ncbi:MAG: ribonucleoside-diphosphate reductase subunit alpha [Verrucomicrobiales bacterium]|nr:ribonucleoside-diphosphate reductase subunit alpha [Verrucomicrobiales bacterium]MBP9223486.1 ribonucleoside-diphosphate reductase subunit alpha [Verrucomicrobiales bacterium]HQZ28330.1 ribonucleoside-diphosphate reductase subunit alpha [Verrucomicrobiales bacterium]
MITRRLIEQDLELQRCAATPQEMKPRFNWSDMPTNHETPANRIKVLVGDTQSDLCIAKIAETVGKAVTDLALSRKQDDIFNDSNRLLVANIVKSVTDVLTLKANDEEEDGTFLLSTSELISLIEIALVRQNAHDVAKSLLIRRKTSNARRDVLTIDSTEKPLCRVIRRNGEVVAWDLNKIEIAVRSSFLSLGMDSSPAREISTALTERIARSGQEFMRIEDLQDRVQEELMRQGHYKVAESFILYRAHRAQLRQLEDEEAARDFDSTQDSMIVLNRADGTSDLWDGADLRRRVEFALTGLELCLSQDEIEHELRRAFFNEMTEADLRKTIILNARSLIERDGDFARFSARILLTYVYEEVLDWNITRDGAGSLAQFHRRAFKANLVRGVEIERISPRLLDFNLDKLADAINPTSDLDFDYLGIQTLYDRYLIIDKTGDAHKRIETPQLFWMRVAMGLMVGEKDDVEAKIIDLYRLYSSRRFCSSTPTLFNSGTLHSQLSSCYLYKVDDSIESIMQRGIAENAYLSKWAGGLGGSWTSVRGTGSYIKGTNGESQGVIPFLKLHNDQLVAVNQGGKRRGSGCAYLETWHNDITDFLELRRNTGDERRRAHDMNTANWIPDLFMQRMEARGMWTLFRSNEVPDLHELYGRAFVERYCAYEADAKAGKIFGREIPAIDLWKQMLKMIFETGHPWMTFKDPCNVRSPQDHVGVIHSSNLCTEITLNTSKEETAVCNLGSIVLDTHIKDDGSLDLVKLKETVRVAVRALDNVIDINFYPTEAAKNANSRHRPIGLGVMGVQNALFLRDTSFASQDAVEFNDEFMEAIAFFAYEASSDLAAERGSYSTFEGSKWHRGLLPHDTIDLLEEERGESIDVPRGGRMDWAPLREKIQRQGMRNSNVLAIAPTATISNIMGSTPCIEPTFKNLFVKGNLSGDFIMLNTYLVKDLKVLGLWGEDMVERLKYYDGELADIEEIPVHLKEKYATAFSINHEWFIDAAARRQKWIDQSQSVNLFLATPDLKTLSHMYRAAWHKGLKTTYYLRTQQASNIEKATTKVNKEVRIYSVDVPSEYTDLDKQQCSIDALLNGGECEACQ